MSSYELSMDKQLLVLELCRMKTTNDIPLPPWDMERAAARLVILENDFNSLDPQKVGANYTPDAEVRFGTKFLNGREEIEAFLMDDFSGKLLYKLKLDLWGALKGRMAVRYVLEWSDSNGQAFKNYGVEVFQFEENGLIEMNFSSFNEQKIL